MTQGLTPSPLSTDRFYGRHNVLHTGNVKMSTHIHLQFMEIYLHAPIRQLLLLRLSRHFIYYIYPTVLLDEMDYTDRERQQQQA